MSETGDLGLGPDFSEMGDEDFEAFLDTVETDKEKIEKLENENRQLKKEVEQGQEDLMSATAQKEELEGEVNQQKATINRLAQEKQKFIISAKSKMGELVAETRRVQETLSRYRVELRDCYEGIDLRKNRNFPLHFKNN